jgi:AcrR family transcriptional regulator
MSAGKDEFPPLKALPAAGKASSHDAPLGRRQQQRIATRERIYKTAIEEFEREGVAAAQIDRIAEKAGVARGTFYFHFPTKELVLIELQHRLQDDFVFQMTETGPAPESLHDFFLQVYEQTMASRREHPRLMGEILAMYARQDMGIALTDEALIVHVVDYLSDAAERGAVRTDIPPEQLAVHFLSGMFVHFMGGRDPETEAEFAKTKIDILIGGMRP